MDPTARPDHETKGASDERLGLPERPIEGLSRPFLDFLRIESASGVVLLVCTATALILANSALRPVYDEFVNRSLRVGFGSLELSYPLWYWINDGLMTIFFFVIGLEIKREAVDGELSERKKILLPILAATGGAMLPALIYHAMTRGGEGEAGWGIPMATDIAFVVGCLALLGSSVPRELKVFMLAVAIIDDILAVLVIAVFYTESLRWPWILAAALGIGVTIILNRLGVRTITAYALVGVGIWLCTLESGVHPTVAGVLLGLLTPASAWLGHASVMDVLDRAGLALRGRVGTGAETRDLLGRLTFATTEAVSPLERLEHALHPWVGFAIIPLFALANAGVAMSASSLAEPVALASAIGLVLGKPIGILLTCWLAVRLGWAALPRGVTWPVLAGAGCLAGIGFTMSLFVASLGLEGELLRSAKSGVLVGSGVSAVVGMALLLATLRRVGSARHGAPAK